MAKKPPVIRSKGAGNKHHRPVKHGLYLKLSDIGGELDGRTKLSKAAAEIQRSLLEYGKHDSPEAAILVRQIVEKTLRLEVFYSHMEAEPTLNLPPAYLPLANSLRLDMQRLDQIAGKEQEVDVEAWLQQVEKAT